MSSHAVKEIMDRALRAARFAEQNPEHPQAVTHAKLIAEVEMLTAREQAIRERLVEISVATEARQADVEDRLDELKVQIEAESEAHEARSRRLLLKGVLVGFAIELAALVLIFGAYRLF